MIASNHIDCECANSMNIMMALPSVMLSTVQVESGATLAKTFPITALPGLSYSISPVLRGISQSPIYRAARASTQALSLRVDTLRFQSMNRRQRPTRIIWAGNCLTHSIAQRDWQSDAEARKAWPGDCWHVDGRRRDIPITRISAGRIIVCGWLHWHESSEPWTQARKDPDLCRNWQWIARERLSMREFFII